MQADDSVYRQQFSVAFDYPVHFTRGLLAPDNPVLVEAICRRGEPRVHRVQSFLDSGLAAAQPDLPERIAAALARHAGRVALVGPPELVPGGERAKNNRSAAERVMESIADHHLCRQSVALVFGGGSVLDIVGLAASLVHRGVRLVRVPTTVLAQCDSGVGVKNGIDAYGVKNFAGTFAPPFAVLVDFDFLATLERRYWTGGLAEAYKVALIKDAAFFAFLQAQAPALAARDAAAMEQAIRRCARLHLDHIRDGGDAFEQGTARPLDFGHWSAHRLEVLSGYELGHGQCVGIGIALDSCYARQLGLLAEEEVAAILAAMHRTGIGIWTGLLERRAPDGRLEVLRGLDEFREHLGGQLTLTLPDSIGARIDVHDVDTARMAAAIDDLKRRAAARDTGGRGAPAP